MATASPQLVQVDRYFYRVITTKQSTPEAKVWLLERAGDAPPTTIYDKRRASKTFANPDEAAVVNELSNWVLLHHTNVLPLIKIARLDYRIAAWMELCDGTLEDVIKVPPYRRHYVYLRPPGETTQVLPQMLSIYALAYYLGSITRYRPHHFPNITSSAFGPRVQDFVTGQPQQFLYLLASEFAKREIAKPSIL